MLRVKVALKTLPRLRHEKECAVIMFLICVFCLLATFAAAKCFDIDD